MPIRFRNAAAALGAVALLMIFSAWLNASAEAGRGPQPVTAPAANAIRYTILLSEYRFTPARITVAKGQRLRLVLKNVGHETHEFELEGYGFEVADIKPGQQTTIVFTANRAGRFEYACHEPGHYEKGMKGTLIVKP